MLTPQSSEKARRIVHKDLTPPGLRYLADNVKHRDNILGASKLERSKWARFLGLPPRGETFFFAGCGYQFGDKLESLTSIIRRVDKSAIGSERALALAGAPRRVGIDPSGALLRVIGKSRESEASPLVDAITVLRRLGIAPAYMGQEEPCCGAIVHYAGLQSDFAVQAKHVHEQLQMSGAKHIISIVPSCTHALRDLIPRVVPAFNMDVKHFCEVVSENLSSLRLRYPGRVKATYHDPCQLVRYLGLVDEPRRILRAIDGIELVEPKWTCGEMATCCGSGGGFEAVFPELSEMLAAKRASELAATGAQLIVTHCPGCMLQLKAGLKATKAGQIEVLDLTQVLARSLGAQQE